MWGHAATCGCPLCHCLRRIFYLINLGQGRVAFNGFAVCAARTFEADLRDELARLGPPPAPASEAKEEDKKGETPPVSQAAPAEGTPEGRLNLTPKVPPPQPPPTVVKSEESATPKAEKEEKVKEASQEVRRGGEEKPKEEKERAASSGRNRRRESRDRRRGDKRTPKRDRSRRRERRSRDRDRKRRHEEDTEEEREAGGKEKKRRSEKPPEPAGPPPHRRQESQWVPREPNYPPPTPRGGGWRGELPRSDHPRWTESTNKGLVKRGKQELHARRREGRR